jgi:hypothetical protein
MALSVSINPSVVRHDSTILPVISFADVANVAYFKIADWLYLTLELYESTEKTVILPNRSLKDAPIILRDNFYPSGDWVLDTDVIEDVNSGLQRSGSEGWNGAYYDTALDADRGSIQATATSTSLSAGISLQDGSNTIVHNYFDSTVAHSVIFGQNGQGSIRELGVLVANNSTFKYEIDDSAMIEYRDGIVRYYLIKADGTLKLLRTTRSKLTEAPKAEVLLYADGSILSYVFLNSDTEVQTTFENIGVMHYNAHFSKTHWQKWGNQQSIQTTADILEMADKTSRYTYPNQKQNLETYGLTPKAFNKEQFAKFIDFVKYHGNEKAFIFVDRARTELDGSFHEIWAKMTGAFVNSTLNGCVYEMTQGLIEDYRNEYIPRLDDETAPVVSISSVTDGGASIAVAGSATDDVLLVSCQMYLNGKLFGDPFVPLDFGVDTFDQPINKSFLVAGNNSIYVIATDYAGNTAQSNTGIFDNS